jgi:hypothetical protein
MDYKKARRIWRNNFPKMFTQGYAIVGGLSHKKYTMPRFASNIFYKDLNKKEETQNANSIT